MDDRLYNPDPNAHRPERKTPPMTITQFLNGLATFLRYSFGFVLVVIGYMDRDATMVGVGVLLMHLA